MWDWSHRLVSKGGIEHPFVAPLRRAEVHVVFLVTWRHRVKEGGGRDTEEGEAWPPFWWIRVWLMR